jgi:hypothetical protein
VLRILSAENDPEVLGVILAHGRMRCGNVLVGFIFGIAVVEVVRDVARVSIVGLAGCMREGVPYSCTAATLVYSSFHLVRGCGGTP